MKFIVSIIILSIGLAGIHAATDKVVCYFGSWSVYRSGNGYFSINDLDPSLCTHVIYTFLGASSSGQIVYLDTGLQPGDFSKLTALKSRNSNLKVMVAMGGWNQGSTQYSTIAASSSLRTTLANNVLNLLNQYNLDGFDLDWEYPSLRGGSSADKANFVLLLQELKSKLSPYNKLLSIAVAAVYDSYTNSYDARSISQHVDFINVMAYDFHMAYDSVVGHHSPLYASAADTTTSNRKLNADSAITAWINGGATASKLILGVPLYGRAYLLQSSSNNKIGSYAAGPMSAGSYTGEAGFLGYLEICEKLRSGGWTTVTDANTRTPYSYKGNDWVGYDNAASMIVKANYAVNKGLGGIMVWSIDTDDKSNVCGGGKYPLMNAINSVIKSGSGSGTTTTTTTKAPTVTTSKTTTQTPSTGTSTCPLYCTSSQLGYFTEPNDPTRFYYCGSLGNGQCRKYEFSCPSGTKFNTSTMQCGY